jgi:hypothetical protein
MDAPAIHRRLTEAISEYTKKRGVRFGQGADAFFGERAVIAADEIAGMPASGQQAKISEAEQAFTSLIDAMIAEGVRIPCYQAGVIGEQTLSPALNKLCPLWPIC